MTELNELFEQIFHAELKFKARTDKLKQLAESIEQGKLEVLRTREEHHNKQGELAVKSSKVADLEVEVKLLSLRKGILQEQRDSLAQNKQQLIEKLAEKKKRCEEERQNFKTKLIEFGCSYDLHGSGFKHRQEETKKKIGLLQDEEMLLKTELVEMDVQKEEVQRLEKKLSEAEENLEKERAKTEELKKTFSEQEAEVERLAEECRLMSQKSSKDPEFIRLQKELESCKACPEEAECKAANRQLRELQQKCYHLQMRQQLNQQKNDVRNRSVDSSRRPGHYNPYICQYVPAPKPSTNSLGEESWSSISSIDSQMQKCVHEKELEDDNMKLVDDEWLIIGDEEYLDDDDDQWDMESLKDEIEDDAILIDSDWSNFDSPHSHDTADTHQLDKDASHFASTAAMSSQSNANSSATRTSQLKYVPPKSTVTAKVLSIMNGISQPRSKIQQSHQEAHGESSRGATQQGPVFRKLHNRERVIPSAALITDSPEPSSVLRKRSGQSIYKAPGSKPSDASLHKKAKKVRFHH